MGTKTYEEWLEWVAAQPDEAFAARNGETIAVFYSGLDEVNKNFAQQDCAANLEYYSIHQTAAGAELDQYQLYVHDENSTYNLTRNQANTIWDLASTRFAEHVHGDVQTHVIDARGDRTFRETELPILLDNEQVTAINGIARDELRALVLDQNFDLAYERVCTAELDHVRELAYATHSQELATQLEWKEIAYAHQDEREREHKEKEMVRNHQEPDREVVQEPEHLHEQSDHQRALDEAREMLQKQREYLERQHDRDR